MEDPKWAAWDRELAEAPKTEEPVRNPYVVALALVVLTSLVLAVVRPPFVMSSCTSGLYVPQLLWARVLMIAIGFGMLVLAMPHVLTWAGGLRK